MSRKHEDNKYERGDLGRAIEESRRLYAERNAKTNANIDSKEHENLKNNIVKKGTEQVESEKKNMLSFKNILNRKGKGLKKSRKKKILIGLIIIIVISAIWLAISTNRWKSIVSDMAVQKNSVILDTAEQEVASVGSEKKKIYVQYSDIPQEMKNAYVAIEDERFYKHGGVDLKRTIAAIGSYIFHFGKSSYGGSTITQQLVKNLTGDSQTSIGRKLTEWLRAEQTESFMSKDEVLGLYLNVIYTGPNTYGVGAGAKYYFNKSVKDLDLAECAFLAGINNSPNSYNPFEGDKTDLIKKRTTIVLDKMKELKYIDESEYNIAIQKVNSGLDFEKGYVQSDSGVFSYHSDSVINEAVSEIAKKYDMSQSFATNYMEMAGLKIYGTADSKIQKEVEAECEKSKYRITSNGETAQAAMVIIEPTTGNVLGCVGGLGEKVTSRSLNRAVQSLRQTGSSIKPLAVLAPGIDKKIITASTICDDTQRDFGNGYAPRDFGRSLGKVTVRRALESSQNVPFVEIIQKINPSTSMNYLKKMGITTLTKEDENLGLALGGLQKGITPLQMAAAYNTIANDGEYIEPTFYKKIVNSTNKVIIETKQTKRRVFSKSVAYILKSLLKQPVEGANGTATYCAISGVDVAAKTGTTDEDYDKWLCGFTPYYTAACWFGYDKNQTISFNNRNPAGLIWANTMSRIHAGKPSAKFEIPTGWFEGVSCCRVCAETGMLARTNCEHTYTEYFLNWTEPGYCTTHSGSENGKIENNTESIKNTVTDVIKNITDEIDAVDPQELEKQTMNVINTVVETTTTVKNEIVDRTNSGNSSNTTRNTVSTNTTSNSSSSSSSSSERSQTNVTSSSSSSESNDNSTRESTNSSSPANSSTSTTTAENKTNQQNTVASEPESTEENDN